MKTQTINPGQAYFSQMALARVRGIENTMGQPFAHVLRHPAAQRATARRLHKITDRRARKLAARYREHVVVYFQHITGQDCPFDFQQEKFAALGAIDFPNLPPYDFQEAA